MTDEHYKEKLRRELAARRWVATFGPWVTIALGLATYLVLRLLP